MSERLKKRLQKVVNQITEGHVVHLGPTAATKSDIDPDGVGKERGGEPVSSLTVAPKLPPFPSESPSVPPLGATPRAGATSISRGIEPFRGVEPHDDVLDHPDSLVPIDQVDIAVDPWTDSSEVFEKPEDVDYDYQGDDWDSSQPFATGEFPYREEPAPEPPKTLTGKVPEKDQIAKMQSEIMRLRDELRKYRK